MNVYNFASSAEEQNQINWGRKDLFQFIIRQTLLFLFYIHYGFLNSFITDENIVD